MLAHKHKKPSKLHYKCDIYPEKKNIQRNNQKKKRHSKTCKASHPSFRTEM